MEFLFSLFFFFFNLRIFGHTEFINFYCFKCPVEYIEKYSNAELLTAVAERRNLFSSSHIAGRVVTCSWRQNRESKMANFLKHQVMEQWRRKFLYALNAMYQLFPDSSPFFLNLAFECKKGKQISHVLYWVVTRCQNRKHQSISSIPVKPVQLHREELHVPTDVMKSLAQGETIHSSGNTINNNAATYIKEKAAVAAGVPQPHMWLNNQLYWQP